MTSAAKSSGRLVRNEPLYPRPTGVLTEETITASVMADLFPGNLYDFRPLLKKKQMGKSKRSPSESSGASLQTPVWLFRLELQP
jgi:hypothetical protein